MAVVINQTPGANYTWQSATWDWNSVNAAKTWVTAYAIAWVCTESDAAPNFSEASPTDITVRDFSAWTTTSARADVWTCFSRAASGLNFAETYSDICAWIQANLEAFSTVDADASAITKRIAESWSTAEARQSAISEFQSDAFAFAEAQADVIAFVKTLNEAMSFAEARADVWTVLRNLPEAMSFVEARQSGVGNVSAEVLALSEAQADVWAVSRNQQESIAFAPLPQKLISKPRQSAFSLAESRADVWDAYLTHARSLSWTESYIDNINWIQLNNETLGVSELEAAQITKSMAEAFSTTSARRALFDKSSPRSLAFSESYTDIINWIQANVESFAFAEVAPTAIVKMIARTLVIRDMMLRQANGIYADITVRSHSMTDVQFAEFMKTRSPVGYEAFKEFLPGDYSFQTALINAAVVPISGASDTMSIQGMSTTVDVPDVTDRGRLALTSAGATITFGRAFTVPPEVVAQQVAGATTAIPVITNITTTSFFIRLYDAANPATAIAGTASWSAAGY